MHRYADKPHDTLGAAFGGFLHGQSACCVIYQARELTAKACDPRSKRGRMWRNAIILSHWFIGQPYRRE